MSKTWDRISYVLFWIGTATMMLTLAMYLKIYTESKDESVLYGLATLSSMIVIVTTYLVSPKNEHDLKGNYFKSWWLK